MNSSSFRTDKAGVWFLPEPSGDKTPDPIWICSPLSILAITRDQNNENHGRLLQFSDSDGKLHLWTMPMELLAGDGHEYRKTLFSMGLHIAPGRKARDLLTNYIQTADPKKKTRCVTKTGWIDHAYVFPDETIAKEECEEILFQSITKIPDCYTVQGSLKDWQNKISHLCVDNSRLGFVVSASLAAPLLQIVNQENIGFHFRGPSSNGKTTLLKVAGSVFGGKKMIHTWRATSNGLESIAAFHNDSLLCLDELGQMSPKEAGETAYMLANGMGKLRANKHCYTRNQHEWNILFLSSGEIGLASHMQEVGKKIKGGQEVRIIDIPSDTGKHGVFEYLHDFKNGADFSRHLCRATEQYCGSAARAFIRKIVSDIPYAQAQIKKNMDAFVEKNSSVGASSQVDRVLHKCAFVAAVGELATEYKVTAWPDNEATWAASECFNSWITNRGGISSQEEKAALEAVRHFFELHGDSRFSDWNENVSKTINRSGYKKMVGEECHFYVFQEVFKNDICSGMNPEHVAKILIDKGWLMPDSEGKSSRSENLPCSDTSVRCYRFIAEKVFGD